MRELRWHIDLLDFHAAILRLYVDNKEVDCILVDHSFLGLIDTGRTGRKIKQLIKQYSITYTIDSLLSDTDLGV